MELEIKETQPMYRLINCILSIGRILSFNVLIYKKNNILDLEIFSFFFMTRKITRHWTSYAFMFCGMIGLASNHWSERN